MPSGSPGTWIYQDEYLQWYCSNQGPGGGLVRVLTADG
jgi:hypothetical protein